MGSIKDTTELHVPVMAIDFAIQDFSYKNIKTYSENRFVMKTPPCTHIEEAFLLNTLYVNFQHLIVLYCDMKTSMATQKPAVALLNDLKKTTKNMTVLKNVLIRWWIGIWIILSI